MGCWGRWRRICGGMHAEQGVRECLATDAVVLATGYAERPADGLLGALETYLRRDGAGRPLVDEEFRLVLDPAVTGSVFVQNAERHTHGVGAPDLGLAPVILNALTGRECYPLPRRTAFTTFGLRGGRSGAGAAGRSATVGV